MAVEVWDVLGDEWMTTREITDAIRPGAGGSDIGIWQAAQHLVDVGAAVKSQRGHQALFKRSFRDVDVVSRRSEVLKALGPEWMSTRRVADAVRPAVKVPDWHATCVRKQCQALVYEGLAEV